MQWPFDVGREKNPVFAFIISFCRFPMVFFVFNVVVVSSIKLMNSRQFSCRSLYFRYIWRNFNIPTNHSYIYFLCVRYVLCVFSHRFAVTWTWKSGFKLEILISFYLFFVIILILFPFALLASTPHINICFEMRGEAIVKEKETQNCCRKGYNEPSMQNCHIEWENENITQKFN